MKKQIRTHKLNKSTRICIKSSNQSGKSKKCAFKDDIAMISGILARNKQIVRDLHDDEADNIVKEIAADQKKHSGSKMPTTAPISFFYTNEKYFAQLDDMQIAQTIAAKYPNFLMTADDVALKNAIIDLLTDKAFVTGLVEFYNMSLQDFLLFIFKHNSAVFKGPYLSKIQKTLASVGYEL